MPIYNDFEFLEEAIKSILNQTHRNLVLIIINDGSTMPEISKIVKSFTDERIVYIENEKN
jgi:glycosyltransferase involved in cell wall biosynthesis